MAKIFSCLKAIHPKILLVLLWLIAIAVICPIGEFPINDDWAFSKNVFNLAVKHQFVVDQWPAMNLVSQTIYGSAFVTCFGFSFTILRFSITILAMISSLVLYDLLCKLTGRDRVLSFFLTVTFCFGSLFCALSFTFMTDIFFLSFVIFALSQLYKYLEHGKYIHYILFLFFSVIAVLDRQHGLLLPVLIAGPVLWKERTIVRKVTLFLLPFIICWLANDKYRHYLTAYGIWNQLQSLDKIKVNFSQTSWELFHQHAGDLLLVTGWILFPLTIVLVSQLKTVKWKDGLIFLLILVCILLLVFRAWVPFPYGNVSNFLEIGPKAVKGDDLTVHDLGFNFIRTCLKTVSVLSISFSVFFLVRDPARVKNKLNSNAYLYFPSLLFLGIYFIFIVISEAYFDRYALPFALIFLLLLVPEISSGSKFKTFILIPAASLIFAVSVLEEKDYFNWQSKRWEAIAWLEKKGVGPHQMDGGFEYNGWNRGTKDFSARPKSWWWIDKDDYVVTNRRLKNHSVCTTFVFQRYIPFQTDTIFVLAKMR